MTPTPDVLIIGGGIIGLTTAYLAAKAGLCVEIYDRSELGSEASWAGAGIIPPGNSTYAATAYDRLRAIGSEQMPAFSDELRQQTHIDNGYRRCGGIEFLADSEPDVLRLWDNERIRYRRLTANQITEIEPSLECPRPEGFLLPDCAQVRNPWHLRALLAACQQRNVRLVSHRCVMGWLYEAGRVRGVRFADESTREAGRYVLAAGAWAEALLKPLGHSPGVHPVRGQILPFRPAKPVLSRIVMIGKDYLVPRSDGLVLAGSTEEPEAGFEKRTTLAGFRKLYEFATTLLPILKDAQILPPWAGLRPGSADGWPYLGPVPGADNVLIAAGHFRAGVQLSLATAMIIVELLLGRPTSVPLEDFRLDRPLITNRPSVFRS